MKFLIVCHRYAPFPGGTEIYCRNIAEELRERGHDVTVLAQTHDPEVFKAGHYNGVKVTSNHEVPLRERFDLIIVHGGDVGSQNFIHENAEQINRLSPVLYLLVKPSNSATCVKGLKLHKYIGISTLEDAQHCDNYGVAEKGRMVRHGIRLSESLGVMNPSKRTEPFFEYSLNTSRNTGRFVKRFVSVGGFWPHKGMQELADIFTSVFGASGEYFLDLYGYDCQHLAPTQTYNIKTHFGKSHKEVIDAIANADLYVMNSYEEGFGLVLLEAMVNGVPWAARNIAGAKLMKDYGITYETPEGLAAVLKGFKEWSTPENIEISRQYAMNNHLIRNTVGDIEAILK
jgi:glycosyltransferase involved in cell wall biosynthesis